jgi:pyridoxine 5''-phosphate synthase (EC 2.6.99.2)
MALDCERFGARASPSPRPDERHIRYSDVRTLRPAVRTEFNIEGNPTGSFTALVCEVVPDQVTLVPDAPDAITSNAGWDTVRNHAFLKRTCASFKERGIRTSIFIDPDPRMAEGAFKCGADRVELYTAGYAAAYAEDRWKAVAPYLETARAARDLGLGLNAGHDLSLENLAFFIHTIPWTDEVSIGHALVCDALYLGLETTIREYLSRIQNF